DRVGQIGTGLPGLRKRCLSLSSRLETSRASDGTTMSHMAAPRAPRRSAAALALVALGSVLLPSGVARAAGPPTLEVSHEITVTATDTAILTATISDAQSTPTIIDF